MTMNLILIITLRQLFHYSVKYMKLIKKKRIINFIYFNIYSKSENYSLPSLVSCEIPTAILQLDPTKSK